MRVSFSAVLLSRCAAVRLALASTLSLVLCACGARVARETAGAASPPPDLVVVLLDNLDATTSPYWEAMPETRRLIADPGLVFTNAFVSDPICCPARASILTGQYPHNHGVLTNGGPRGGWTAFHQGGGEARAFPIALQRAGYRTALIGKYLNGYEQEPDYIPPGWSEWFVDVDTNLPRGFDYSVNDDGERVRFRSEESDYNTDVFAREAVEFIRHAAADDVPFLAFLAITAPHVPIAAPPRHADHPWVDATVPRSPAYDEADLSDKPEWLRRSEPARRRLEPWNHVDYRNRMGSLLAVDDLVVDVVDALEAAGRLENTYLIFASDNGYNLGAHALIHMMAPYEESIRVPVAIRGPGVPAGREERMVLLMDLAPTLLELAGLPVPGWTDALSWVPLLRGEAPDAWRSDILLEYETGWAHRGLGWGLPEARYFEEQILGGQDIPSYRALRTPRYTFIDWFYDDGSGPRHEHELYDLARDPHQLDNVLATPVDRDAHQALAERLRARLEALSRCSGAGCRE